MNKNNGIEVLTNSDPGFYGLMGRIFGSRIVQNVTGDRFFDDSEKVWYIHFDSKNKPDVYISVKNNMIKNVYAKNSESLVCVLNELLPFTGISNIPTIYKEDFIRSGYSVLEKAHKNFVKVRGNYLEPKGRTACETVSGRD